MSGSRDEPETPADDLAQLRVAVLVLSDQGSRGEREDRSGPELVLWLAERSIERVTLELLPDELDLIAERLISWADGGTLDLILTCGGTGVSPRDVTPEATRRAVDIEIPGFGELMRATSSAYSSHAIISRALAGVRAGCLIVNLPGSPKAARENLAAVWPAIPHAIAKLQGDPADCGSD